jgi:hypothetical protein
MQCTTVITCNFDLFKGSSLSTGIVVRTSEERFGPLPWMDIVTNTHSPLRKMGHLRSATRFLLSLT